MKKSYLYLLFALLGIAVPYSQFVPWSMDHGFEFQTMLDALFVNQLSAGVFFDALLVGIFLIFFIILEQKERKIPYIWIPILGIFLFGVSFAFPMYLFLREQKK